MSRPLDQPLPLFPDTLSKSWVRSEAVGTQKMPIWEGKQLLPAMPPYQPLAVFVVVAVVNF